MFICKTVHLLLIWSHKCYLRSQLSQGYPAAHRRIYLWLLPSRPDQFHRCLLRGPQSSSPLAKGKPYMNHTAKKEFNPAKADCRLQGTAISPSSTVCINDMYVYGMNNTCYVSYISNLT